MKITRLLPLVLVFSVMISGCKKDPEIVNEEELITTLEYTLVDQIDGSMVTLRFVDLDGDGGESPTITNGILNANSTYTGSLSLSNDAETPSEDITIEVSEEDVDHQLFYVSTLSNFNVSYNDQDGNGDPIGLNTTVTTGDAETGTLTITLRHEPDKSAEGVAEGNITNAGGETDIEVRFNVEVQ